MVRIPMVLEYMRQLGSLPELASLMDMQATPSYPIPVKSDGNTLHFFLYSSTLFNARESRIERPYAYIVVDLPDFTLRFQQTGEDIFPDLSREFPVTLVRTDELETIPFQLDAFQDLYDILLKTYPVPQPAFVVDRFRGLFASLVPEPLLPFYRAMNPEFAKYIGF